MGTVTLSSARESLFYPQSGCCERDRCLIMKEWTVVLKTPVGLSFEIVNADYAAWDDENERLEFTNVKPGTDLLRELSKMQSMGKTLNEEEAVKLVLKLLTVLPQMTVAGFAKDSVAGYFEGRSATIKVDLEPR